MVAAATSRASNGKTGVKKKDGVLKKPVAKLASASAKAIPPVSKKPAAASAKAAPPANVKAICDRIDMSAFFDHLKKARHAPNMYRRLFCSQAYKEGRKQAQPFTKTKEVQNWVGREQHHIASNLWDATATP